MSARLDGEPLEMSAAALDAHLSTCPACAWWADEAARLTRTARVARAEVPDLSESIVTEAVLDGVRVTARRARRPVMLLRVLLVLVGLIQFGVSIPDLFGDSVGMHMGAHAAHESAAWNAALGAALVAVAARPRRAAGLLPLLAVFVALLVALSSYDLSQGAVDASRLATHAGAVASLAILAALVRSTTARPDPQAVGDDARAAPESAAPRLRGVA